MEIVLPTLSPDDTVADSDTNIDEDFVDDDEIEGDIWKAGLK